MLTRLLIFACWIALPVYWRQSAGSAKPAAQTQSVENRMARFPVWLGFLLVLVAGVFPSWCALPVASPAAAQWSGIAVCVLGLALAVWSRKTLGGDWSQDVELKQWHRLVVRGPYRLVRHPIYTAHLLMAVGSAITFGTWLGYAAVMSFFVGFRVKLAQEEELLTRSFPGEYAEYRKRTKALLPWLL
jgi:protein-S-isoprenylcysteine O-methyltransferase Ste14